MKELQKILILLFILAPIFLFAQSNEPLCQIDQIEELYGSCDEPCFERVNKKTEKIVCCCDVTIGIPGNDCNVLSIFETNSVIGTIDPCTGGHCQILKVGPFWAAILTNKHYDVIQTTLSKDPPNVMDKPLEIKDKKVINYIEKLYYTLEANGGKPPRRR